MEVVVVIFPRSQFFFWRGSFHVLEELCYRAFQKYMQRQTFNLLCLPSNSGSCYLFTSDDSRIFSKQKCKEVV